MIYVLISAAIIAADQLLKGWVTANIPLGSESVILPGLIKITHVQNTGAAFSQFQGILPIIIIITALFCMAALFGLILKPIKSRFGNIALAMVLGGALGNFLDRIDVGYVVDMFEFIFVKFAIFNVADVFITCGAIMFCIFIIFNNRKHDSGSVRLSDFTGDGEAEDKYEISTDIEYDLAAEAGYNHTEIDMQDMAAGKEKDYDPGNSGT